MKRITALILLAGFTHLAWAQSTPDPMTPIQAHPGTQQDIAPNAPENSTQVAAPTVVSTTSSTATTSSPALPARTVVLPQASATRGANVTVTSHPNDPVASGWRAEFRALDVDQDGVLSRSEARSKASVLQQFASLDADRDGTLSRSETEHVIN